MSHRSGRGPGMRTDQRYRLLCLPLDLRLDEVRGMVWPLGVDLCR